MTKASLAGATALCRSLLRRAALLVALAVSACGRPPLVGTWMGRDEGGESLVYSFHADGSGTQSVGGRQAPLTYRLRQGYPNLIEIAVGDTASPEVRQGLVRIGYDRRMRLQLGPAGGPPPRQLTSDALVLRQQATR